MVETAGNDSDARQSRRGWVTTKLRNAHAPPEDFYRLVNSHQLYYRSPLQLFGTSTWLPVGFSQKPLQRVVCPAALVRFVSRRQ